VVVAWAARSAGLEAIELAPASAYAASFRLERLPRATARMDAELISAISQRGR
jgi:hypothetical protein